VERVPAELVAEPTLAAVVADTSVEAAVVMPAVAVVTAAADTGKLFGN